MSPGGRGNYCIILYDNKIKSILSYTHIIALCRSCGEVSGKRGKTLYGHLIFVSHGNIISEIGCQKYNFATYFGTFQILVLETYNYTKCT